MPFRKITWEHEWARGLYIAVVIGAAVAMAILFILMNNDRNDIRREANIRATQIQQQRYDTTYASCVDQNRRHAVTIKRLRRLAAKYVKAHPGSKAAIKASFKQEKFLISGIVPHRNCKAVAKKAVHPLVNPEAK